MATPHQILWVLLLLLPLRLACIHRGHKHQDVRTFLRPSPEGGAKSNNKQMKVILKTVNINISIIPSATSTSSAPPVTATSTSAAPPVTFTSADPLVSTPSSFLRPITENPILPSEHRSSRVLPPDRSAMTNAALSDTTVGRKLKNKPDLKRCGQVGCREDQIRDQSPENYSRDNRPWNGTGRNRTHGIYYSSLRYLNHLTLLSGHGNEAHRDSGSPRTEGTKMPVIVSSVLESTANKPSLSTEHKPGRFTQVTTTLRKEEPGTKEPKRRPLAHSETLHFHFFSRGHIHSHNFSQYPSYIVPHFSHFHDRHPSPRASQNNSQHSYYFTRVGRGSGHGESRREGWGEKGERRETTQGRGEGREREVEESQEGRVQGEKQEQLETTSGRKYDERDLNTDSRQAWWKVIGEWICLTLSVVGLAVCCIYFPSSYKN